MKYSYKISEINQISLSSVRTQESFHSFNLFDL